MFIRNPLLLRPVDDEFSSTGGIDPAAFAADMFPGSTSTEGSSADSGGAAVSSASSASAGETSTNTSAAATGAASEAGLSQAEYDSLPKSWRAEMEAEWKTATPALRKYVHEREHQVTNGIKGYKTGYENWGKIMDPFKDVLREYPDADPAGVLTTLANNHIAMLRATPAERAQHAIALARGYGVELTPAQARAAVAAAADAPQSPQADGFSPGQIAALQRLLAPVQQAVDYTRSQTTATAEREVDAFFSDPKNAFVNEVADDILALMQKGRAESLAEAYELAVMRNPTVKAKYLSSLIPATQTSTKPAPGVNIKSSATPPRSANANSISDTIDSIVQKHYK